MGLNCADSLNTGIFFNGEYYTTKMQSAIGLIHECKTTDTEEP